MTLPVDLDITYPDDAAKPGKKAHQQHHDAVHALHNGLVAAGLDGTTIESKVGAQAKVDALKAEVLRPSAVIAGDGIDPTGATDSAAATQALIDAMPNGGFAYLPALVHNQFYRWDTPIVLRNGKRLVGGGYRCLWDLNLFFGHVDWDSPGAVRGAVVKSTVTTGIALSLDPEAQNKNGVLQGFALIGPGSGTSIGLQVGLSTKAFTGAEIRDVLIGNFHIGTRWDFFEASEVYGLHLRGCNTANIRANDTNDIRTFGLNIQKCGDGIVVEDNAGRLCQANTDYSPTLQSNTGTSVIMRGHDNKLIAPYFENPGSVSGLAVDFVAGIDNQIDSPFFAYPSTKDKVNVQAAAASTRLLKLPKWPGPVTVTNAGTNTELTGATSGLTDSGAGTGITDLLNGRFQLPAILWTTYTPTISGTGWSLGNGTMTARWARIGRTIHVRVGIVWGTTSTFGSGALQVSWPVAPHAQILALQAATRAVAVDGSAATYYDLGCLTTATFCRFRATGAGGGAWGADVISTVPFTWASGDEVMMSSTYEAAS